MFLNLFLIYVFKNNENSQGSGNLLKYVTVDVVHIQIKKFNLQVQAGIYTLKSR